MSDEERLRKIFRSIDLDGDGSLNATEITKAFEKSGSKPSPTEVFAMIAEADTTGNGVIDFNEFVQMFEKVKSGAMPKTTGLAQLIKTMWEDYIEQINKPVEKNKMMKGKGSEYKNEAPQGEKYKLGSKKKGYKPGSLPAKKDFDDLP